VDRITANLPARNFTSTSAFYARLGFVEVYRDPHWMIMSRGALELEFFPYPDLDPSTSSFSACVRVRDLNGLYTAWSSIDLPLAGIPRVQGLPRSIADGLRMFAVVDLDGSLLRCLGED
jgi:hypothetical protein